MTALVHPGAGMQCRCNELAAELDVLRVELTLVAHEIGERWFHGLAGERGLGHAEALQRRLQDDPEAAWWQKKHAEDVAAVRAIGVRERDAAYARGALDMRTRAAAVARERYARIMRGVCGRALGETLSEIEALDVDAAPRGEP